jgi:hypothetical protein
MQELSDETFKSKFFLIIENINNDDSYNQIHSAIIDLDFLLNNFTINNSRQLKNLHEIIRIAYGYLGFILNSKGFFVLSSMVYNSYSLFVKNDYRLKINKLSRLRNMIWTDSKVTENSHTYLFRKNQIYKVYESIFSNFYLEFSKISKAFSLKFVDKKFNDLISGKKLTIIAPGKIYPEDFSRINDADIIVFLNHMSFNKTYIELKELISNKVIISYYSGGREQEMDIKATHDYLNTMDFSVWSNKRIHRKNRRIDVSKLRGLRNHNVILEHGRLNFAIYAIIDLLMFEVGCLHLVGIDFFLNVEVYSKGYDSLYSDFTNVSERWESFAHHNQLAQFKIIKYLFNNDRITINSQLSNLIELSDHEFSELIEEFYPRDTMGN